MWWNNVTLKGFSKSVKDNKWTSALAYDEINNEMMKYNKKNWWIEQWNDETLEGLTKSVKHTKSPSAFIYN